LNRYVLFVVLLLTVAAGAWAQSPATPKAVLRLDPVLDSLISPSAKLELLKGDYFGFVEGPVWVPEGSSGFLLFSDLPANAIYKWTPKRELSVAFPRSGFTGRDSSTAGAELNNGRLTVIILGSNGLTRDRQGRLVICAHGDRALVRLEKDGTRTILADRYEGKRLNSPNDVVVKSNGSIYFTDPPFGLRGAMTSPLRELPFHGVFLLKDGKVRLLDKDPQGAFPNGIAFSPDEKYLYVTGGQRITRYEVQPDDTVANGRVLVDMTADKAPGSTDGMKVDQKGNLYATGPGGIWIISPEGKPLGKILMQEAPANLAFGDPDGKSLYVTARRGLYRIRLNAPGIRP
jgi:gluconolactonase